MIVASGGVALHLEVEGSGAAVVCLHGHALDWRMWDDQAPLLVRRGFRVARYDLRGHGRSSSPPAGYRWGDHAADLEAIIDWLGEDSADLVGFSKGAGVALELAVRRPERVRSLALISPWVQDHPLSEALRASLRAVARSARDEGVAAAMATEWLRHPLLAAAMAQPGIRERLEAMALGFPGGEYLATRDAPDRDWSVLDRLSSVAAPALVVSGDQDLPDLLAMASTLAAKLPRVRAETLSGAGHFVSLERPSQVAALLADFIAGV